MASSVRPQPPSSFEFKNPDEWARWKRRFEQFRLASGLDRESEEKQVCTLMYCMGEDAEDTLATTNISAGDRKKYDSVIAKFDAFCKVRKNVIFERARFNRRSQQQDETAEQFITSLYSLAENCEYGDLRDEMIRDRIVVGIRDRALSERPQLDPDLTLEKAKTQVRQRHEQQAILKAGGPKQEMAVEFVRRSKSSWRGRVPHKTPPRGNQQQSPRGSQAQSATNSSKCTRCGKGPHPRQSCPERQYAIPAKRKDTTVHSAFRSPLVTSQSLWLTSIQHTSTQLVPCKARRPGTVS